MRRAVKVLCGVLFLVCISAGQVLNAETPASSDEIQKLFVAMHMRERVEIMVAESRKHSTAMLNDYLLKQVPGASKRPEQVRKIVDEWVDNVFKDYQVDSVLQDFVPIYQRHLNSSEVTALVEFYSSAVGQKMLRELPVILGELSQALTSRIQPRIDAAAVNLKDEVTRMFEEEEGQSSTGSSKPAHKQ